MVPRLALLILLVVTTISSFGQNTASPPKGETWLRIAFEGRGEVVVKLHTREAPKATSHVTRLAEQGFYDGQRVFRVDKTPRPYWVQMGDPLTKSKDMDDPAIGTGGTGARIEFEDSGFSNVAGSVGLATKPQDRNSGDSQFYLLLGDATLLDGKYTVFGQVVRGMDALRKVEKGDRIVSVRLVRG
ncbi:MAG: peptidylprolyl isomerase [Fimbriimonadaceae bacterium]|nr:peptidylprolyl isomerase [Fimbriimonadaceae bacterium]